MIDFSIARLAARAWEERKNKLLSEDKAHIYRIAYYRGFRDAQDKAKVLEKETDKEDGCDNF